MHILRYIVRVTWVIEREPTSNNATSTLIKHDNTTKSIADTSTPGILTSEEKHIFATGAIS
jgi:hypothetical protein